MDGGDLALAALVALATLLGSAAGTVISGRFTLRADKVRLEREHMIHRERLAHEQRESDLAAIREFLQEGTALAHRARTLAEQIAGSGTGRSDRLTRAAAPLVEELSTLTEREFEAYSQRLLIWFGPSHPVCGTWSPVTAQCENVVEAADYTTVESAMDRLVGAIAAWSAEAHAVARARM